MELLGLIVSVALAGGWIILQVFLSILIVVIIYYLIFNFICAIWSMLHEPSFLYIKSKVKSLFEKKAKKVKTEVS